MNRKSGRATIVDVARAAEVSTATVSFVLNRSGTISADVRQRVLAAAHAVNYRPNNQAKAMRTGRSMTIGLILPDLRNPFFSELAAAMDSAAAEAGYTLLLGGGQDDVRERESLDRLSGHGVDGICWCPSSAADVPHDMALHQPIVVVDRPMARYDSVISDYVMGGRLLAEEVVRAGFRTVGLVVGPRTLPGAQQRRQAFVDAIGDQCRIVWEVENSFSMDLDAAVEQAIMAADVDAILCANDMIAIGILRHLRLAGRRVPDDVAVLGFDDIPWAELVEPSLTTIRQPLQDIGRSAIGLLLRRIADPDCPITHQSLPVALCRRAST